MARIKYLQTFIGWVKLFKLVKPKVLALAVPNPIDNFLTEETISLVDDETAVTAAEAADKVFNEQSKEAEEQTEKAKNLFDPAWKDHIACVQFLKKHFRKAPHKLGDYGVTLDGLNRVKYPASFDGRKKCVRDLITFHNTLPPATAPLTPFLAENDIDFADNLAATTAAETAYAAQDAANALKEQKSEERDLLMKPVINHLRGMGGVAVKWYESAPKKAGALGFEIDDSPQGYALKTFIVKEGQQKTVHDALLESVMKNQSDINLRIHKGKTLTANPIILEAGKSMLVGRGFSTFIIENQNLDKKGSVQLTVHK